MPRVVLDSTILVSAFLDSRLSQGGLSLEIFRYAQQDKFSLCNAEAILNETRRVLLTKTRVRRCYIYSDRDVETYINILRDISLMMAVLPEIAVIRDPEDNKILACALAARATILVTRDRDLLDLEHFGSVRIMTPENFIRLLRAR